MIQEILCSKQDDYHDKKCLYGECSPCGIDKLKTFPDENDTADSAPLIKLERFEYVACGKDSSGKDKKKTTDCPKRQHPFQYFRQLLVDFQHISLELHGNTNSLSS